MIKYILAIILLYASTCLAGLGIGVTPWPGPGTHGGVAVPASCSSGSCIDTFIGVDNTLLATHDPNWVSYQAGKPVGNLKIVSGKLQATAWTDGSALYSTSTSDTSSIYVVPSGTTAIPRAVFVRATAGSVEGYLVLLRVSDASNWLQMRVYKNGSYLAETSTFTQSLSSAYTLKITASGQSPTTVKAYIDGVEKVSVVDSTSPILAGNPGFYVESGSFGSGADIETWTDY